MAYLPCRRYTIVSTFTFWHPVFLVKSCHHSRAPETPDSEIALSISLINHAAECASINATHYSSVARELIARTCVFKLSRTEG